MNKTGFISKEKNRYAAYYYVDGKRHVSTYSIKRYGKYIAYKLAKLSLRDKRKYYDYFEIDGDVASFYIHTKTFGVCRMDIDIEDFELVSSHKISIEKNRYTYYATNEENGAIHRQVLGVTDGTVIVDHLDKNGLNNRRSNLRAVSTSINNRNTRLRSDNKSGTRGVFIENHRATATFRDSNGNQRKKSFSFNIYGKDEAIKLAIEARQNAEKEYGYIEINESSETNPNKFVNYLLIP